MLDQTGNPHSERRMSRVTQQVVDVHPTGIDQLVLADVDVKGQGSQSADDVDVGDAEGPWHVVLLTEAQDGLEF